MFARARGLTILGCLPAAALFITACGGSSNSGGTASTGGGSASASAYAKTAPAQIVKDAVGAMSAATSFQIAGHIDVGGSPASTTVGVDGTDLVASVQQGSELIRFIVVGQDSYLYGNAGFWKKEAGASSNAEVKQFADKWFKTPARSAASLTRELGQVSPRQVASCLSQDAGTPTSGGTATVNGTAAVEVHISGGRSGASPGNLYVSAAAPHYPVRFQQTGTSSVKGTGPCSDGPTSSENGKGIVDFSQWNAVKVTAPANAAKLP